MTFVNISIEQQVRRRSHVMIKVALIIVGIGVVAFFICPGSLQKRTAIAVGLTISLLIAFVVALILNGDH